jgi:hypothetical protein
MASLVVFLAVLLAPAEAASVSATSAAQAWLRTHAGAPDELAELKGANPEAYALVNALLTKRSLGLLNAKHPTASMADTAPAASQMAEPVERGPQAFAKFATPAEVPASQPEAVVPHVELPYANVKSSHHDWLNWTPHSSTADETMVANVLGMVGGMKGAPASSVPEASPVMAAPAEVSEREPAAPVVEDAAPKASSDWGSIGSMLGLKHEKPHRQVAPQTYEDAAPQTYLRQPVAKVATPTSNGKDWTSMEKMKQNSDDKAVANLLGMVAQLKGGKQAEKLLKKHHIASSEDNALSNDLAAFGDAPEEVPLSAPVAPQSMPQVATPEVAAPEVVTPARVEVPTETAPVSTASAPEQHDSWGSIGGMLGVKKPVHKAASSETSPVAMSSSPYGLNWKPKPAAADEAMVANVLGMVGTKGAPPMPEESSTPVASSEAVPQEVAPQVETQQSSGKDEKANSDEKAVSNLLNMVAQLKGGKAAAKLLSKHRGEDQENTLSNDAAEFTAPEATPAAEASAPQHDGWGAIGSMLGIRHKTAPTETVKQSVAVEGEGRPAEAMPSEVQALVSDNHQFVQASAPKAAKGNDWNGAMKSKQNADDTAVKSLLSMVAQLKGSKKAEKLAQKYDDGSTAGTEQAPENPLAKDENIFTSVASAQEVPSEAVAPPQAEENPETSTAPANKRNLFLDSLTSSLATPAPTHRHVEALAKENSYLKGLDLNSEAESESHRQAAFASSASNKIMASWFSDSGEDKAPKPQEQAPRKRKSDSLLSWLDPESQQSQPAKPAEPQAPVNPYLADLSGA